MELAPPDLARLHPLTPHSASDPGAVRGIEAVAWRTASGLRLAYTLHGSLDTLALPAPARPARRDELWRHTCFEAFVRVAGEAGYAEFNFSPSGEWAAYGFDGYRAGMRALAVASPPRMRVVGEGDRLQVDVHVDELPPPWGASAPLRLALTAVVEHANGASSYWSVAHPAGRPDFHHEDGFVVPCE